MSEGKDDSTKKYFCDVGETGLGEVKAMDGSTRYKSQSSGS